jgi:hypothetical protein
MNPRMANAIWDDAGWAAFDADKNTSNFIAALPTYASYGLNNVTVSLQDGATGRVSRITYVNGGCRAIGGSRWMGQLFG